MTRESHTYTRTIPPMVTREISRMGNREGGKRRDDARATAFQTRGTANGRDEWSAADCRQRSGCRGARDVLRCGRTGTRARSSGATTACARIAWPRARRHDPPRRPPRTRWPSFISSSGTRLPAMYQKGDSPSFHKPSTKKEHEEKKLLFIIIIVSRYCRSSSSGCDRAMKRHNIWSQEKKKKIIFCHTHNNLS